MPRQGGSGGEGLLLVWLVLTCIPQWLKMIRPRLEEFIDSLGE